MALTTSNHALAPVARVVTPMHVAVAPRAPVHPPVHGLLGPDVKLVLHSAVPAHAEPYETLAVMPNETIQDVRLRLCNRGWYSSKSCLVFGDRELADAVKVSDLVSASGRAHPSYLHVFVKLSDVESVNIRTMMRELSLANPMSATPLNSAVSHLLALPAIPEPQQAAVPDSTSVADSGSSSSASVDSSSRSSPFAEAAAGAADSTSSSSSSDSQVGRAVIHLMVNKRARVNWHHLQENKFELSISSSDTVDSLMRKIEAANGLALEPEALLLDGQPLSAGQPLAAYGISKGSVLELSPLEPVAAADDSLPDGSPSLASPAHQLHQHWQEARAGLAEGIAPQLVAAGTGGSYFLNNVEGRPVAVFKPEDEEPLAINNPKGRTPGSSGSGSSQRSSAGASGGASSGSEGLRRGTRPGEGAVREVAAYVLDHGHFAGVPPTALVNMAAGGAVKVGSLQQFVVAEGDCEERGYSAFPVQEVHKIAVLDLRLANADRNGGNILCERGPDGGWRLVPIDHGYILPASFEDLSFEWMYWPQAEQPFDAATLAYIAALDAERDLATLQAHGITLRPECARVFRVCTRVLQKGAAAGLTAAQLAAICCREGLTKSHLEKLHSNALQLTRAACGRSDNLAVYMATMEQLLDEYLEDFLLEGLI